jgi:acid phosphatase family membrane protein YuiD
MRNIFAEFMSNRVILASLIAWISAQTLKVFWGLIRHKRFNFMWLIGTGGMPSSHSAGVTAMATSVGFYSGFDSVFFAIALIFALVIMFDAQGVRRSTGHQARILNVILEDLYWKKGLEEKKLKELLGHTPIEVFAGAALGIFIATIMYRPN